MELQRVITRAPAALLRNDAAELRIERAQLQKRLLRHDELRIQLAGAAQIDAGGAGVSNPYQERPRPVALQAPGVLHRVCRAGSRVCGSGVAAGAEKFPSAGWVATVVP